VSFREIAVTFRAVNHASTEFARIQTDAESLAARVRALGSAFTVLGATGTAVGHIAHQFGLLNDEQARVFNSAMMVVSVFGMFMRTSWGVAVAQKVYTAACWVSTAAQNALNISFATFLALTGVGIAVIIAAAAAMWSFAGSMNNATESVKSFNAASTELSTNSRSLSRGSEDELYRRGVER
jgi:hypothetical protein